MSSATRARHVLASVDEGALDVLHRLVADWQLIADLSFADLVLWVEFAGEGFVAVRHVRPSTGASVFLDDIVGRCAGGALQKALTACVRDPAADGDVRVAQPGSENPLDMVPVMCQGSPVAVVTRHRASPGPANESPLETAYRDTAHLLMSMVAEGQFPLPTSSPGRRGTPRVGDGVVALDPTGHITFASPNATSALTRLGHDGPLVGASLSTVVTHHVQANSVVDEALPLVTTGRAAWRADVEGLGATVSLRSIPLVVGGRRRGALILVRDVSELRRADRELLTKDATIREIHHRVKNNLQTVAALLRLQSRRVSDRGAREALEEAGRRVGTIAIVHELLSGTIDESVQFDDVVGAVVPAVIELSSHGQRIEWHRTGRFDRIGAEDATALAMVIAELVQNAVQHAFVSRGGSIVVGVQRDADMLEVYVEDDGVGLPSGLRPDRAGLGSQIVVSLVSDLGGRVRWEDRVGGGTRAALTARLRSSGVPGEGQADQGGKQSHGRR